MKLRLTFLFGTLALLCGASAQVQSELVIPRKIEAGSAFSVQISGNGSAVLYIVGPEQVLKRDVQRGGTISIPAGTLNNAGRYVAALAGGSTADTQVFDVVPAAQPASVSFLAKPSRLPVGLQNGITGAAYLFDAYRNLVTTPQQVTFQLSGNGGSAVQTRTVTSRDGAAWTQLDSAAKQGTVQFTARVGDISSTRVIEEVPGDPCGLRMTAKPTGGKIELQTDPLRDCSGNPVPDGTIVTFTENYNGAQTTVDVPLKHGVATADVPEHPGAIISAATGVVMGNEIHWGRQ
jgi:hypothetical protein